MTIKSTNQNLNLFETTENQYDETSWKLSTQFFQQKNKLFSEKNF
jgi:hypothetical protein